MEDWFLRIGVFNVYCIARKYQSVKSKYFMNFFGRKGFSQYLCNMHNDDEDDRIWKLGFAGTMLCSHNAALLSSVRPQAMCNYMAFCVAACWMCACVNGNAN